MLSLKFKVSDNVRSSEVKWQDSAVKLKYFSVCAYSVASVVSDSVTLWTVARQAPLSMGFSRQEYWSGLPCLPRGIEPASCMSPALADGFFTTSLHLENPFQSNFLQYLFISTCKKEYSLTREGSKFSIYCFFKTKRTKK